MVDEIKVEADVSGQPEEQTSAEQTDRPQWLPEKFTSAEELAKSYTELEKSYSEKSQAAQNDLNPFFNEYAEKGELGEESYTKLQGMGLGKDVVDNYINGMKAQSDLQVTRIHNEVGGADSYNNMVTWASENLSEAEVNSFNNTMENGTGDDAILVAKGMAARYQATQSPKTQEPNLFKGDAAQVSDAFRSTAEVVNAINDKRYAADTAYRKDVEEKIKRSNVL
jgi:spore coat protein CotF